MFYNLFQINKTDPLFRALEGCKGITQDPKHHPEIYVFDHCLQTMEWAFRESTDIDLIFASMLHDVGKRIDTKGHEQYALKMLSDNISEKTAWLIKHHMRFWYFILGTMVMKSKVEYLVNHKWFPDLCRLCRWDKLGRNPNKQIKYDRLEIIYRLRELEK